MDELETQLAGEGDGNDTFGDTNSTFWDDTAVHNDTEEETWENHFQLLRTLVPSPVIKDIFEANIRSPTSQDIIFIKVRGPPAFCPDNQNHSIELYILTYTSFVLECSLPIRGAIRAAVAYSRPRDGRQDHANNIFSRIAQATSEEGVDQQQSTDLILCTVDTGELMVVEWINTPQIERDDLWSNPGLCVTRVIRQARPGKDTSAPGRFLKVSEE